MGLIDVFAEEGPKKGVGLINGGFLVGLQSGGGSICCCPMQPYLHTPRRKA